MKDGGLIPIEKLDVTKKDNDDHSTTIIVKSQDPTSKTPVWSSIIVKSNNAVVGKFTPMDENKKPAGVPKVIPFKSDTPNEIKAIFDTPVTAYQVEIVFVPKSSLKPAGGEVSSVVACVEGKINSNEISN
jgi:hypothetical protein